jgi:hypothetical protein
MKLRGSVGWRSLRSRGASDAGSVRPRRFAPRNGRRQPSGLVREQHLAQRGGVRREQRAHVERLEGVVGPEDVVHDQHLAFQQRADPHGLATAGGQRVGPVDGAGAQLVDVEVAGAEVQQRRPELVLARGLVLLDEADVLERADDAVRGALRQVQGAGDLEQPEPSRAAGEEPKDGGCASDGLHLSRHGRMLTPFCLEQQCSTMPTGVR